MSARWLERLTAGPCPSCAASACAPLCRTCRVDSGIADGLHPGTIVLENALNVAYLGLYWCRLPEDSTRRREPTPLACSLQRFKFSGDRYAGHCLARLFAEVLFTWAAQPHHGAGTRSRYDAIVPIPLSNAGLSARRFNQSAWLARRLARRARIAYHPGWLRRPDRREPQHRLGAAARRANMHGAFEARRLPLPPRRILLIDDVCTTGSTLAEAVRVLMNAGAQTVDAAVLALADSANEGR